MTPLPTFTIFIPTYNRAYILPQALASIERQNTRDFEVLVVDDGSTDNTHELVEDWGRNSGIPVRYYWHENVGTQRTYNRALQLARGQFFVHLDSDNMLAPSCLERILHHWNAIPPSERGRFAGIEGLFASRAGEIEGGKFPADVVDVSYIEMRRSFGLRGDRGGALRLEIARQFPFPEIDGEKHVRPSTVWKRISHAGYKLRCVNDVMQIFDRQADGKTANRFRLRMRNPKGFRLYFQEDINLHAHSRTGRALLRSAAEYARYSFHSGVGLNRQWRDIDRKALWCLALPRGWLRWLVDRARIRSRGL